MRKVSDAIGIIDILYQAGNSTCTAFLIADDLLLTNWHCVPGDGTNGRVEAVEFVPNYLDSARVQDRVKFSVDPAPVEDGGGIDLDYAILRVEGYPGRTYGTLNLTSEVPTAAESLVIVHHPQGLPKQITRFRCRAASPDHLDGRRLLHQCDTLPGSSGAPLLDGKMENVVALHHAGHSLDRINWAFQIAKLASHSSILTRMLDSPASDAIAECVAEFVGGSLEIGGQTCRQVRYCEGGEASYRYACLDRQGRWIWAD